MPKLKATSPEGREVEFEWDGDVPPTDAELDEIFAEASAMKPPAKPEKSLGGFVSNVVRNAPEAVMNTLKGVAAMDAAVRDPLFTGGRMASGLLKGVTQAGADAVRTVRDAPKTIFDPVGLGALGNTALDYAYERPVEAGLDVLSVLPRGAILRGVGRVLPDAGKRAAAAEQAYKHGLKTPVTILKRNRNTLGPDPERALARKALDEGIPITEEGIDKVARVIDRDEAVLDQTIANSTVTRQAPDYLTGGRLEQLYNERVANTAVDPGHRRLNATRAVAEQYLTDPAISTPLPPPQTGRVFRATPIQTLQALKKDINRRQVNPAAWQNEVVAGTDEALMELRGDLARGIADAEPAVADVNRSLSQLYPLQEAMDRARTRFSHQDPLPWRGMVGSTIFGGGGGLARHLIGAFLGYKINSPKTISQWALANDELARRLPGLQQGLTTGVQAGARGMALGASDVTQAAIREALLAELQGASTERP
jgi:hypothetical protein